MGGSIAAMHSAAVTAIVAPAVIRYPWQVQVASFVFGILVSASFALLVGFRERFHAGFTIRKLFTAFILGCGIHLLRPSSHISCCKRVLASASSWIRSEDFFLRAGVPLLCSIQHAVCCRLLVNGTIVSFLQARLKATHAGLSVQDIRTSWWSEILPYVAATRTGLKHIPVRPDPCSGGGTGNSSYSSRRH